MLVSEICEYLGSGLKVPTEINGFLLSIDASLYQKRKIENLILCWFYASNQIKFIQSQTYIASNMGKHIKMQLQRYMANNMEVHLHFELQSALARWQISDAGQAYSKLPC